MINSERSDAKAPNIKKNYRIPKVYDALEIVFSNKCYLCETQEENPENFDIEHFKPHKGDKSLKYNWANLYLACHNCNQYKAAFLEDILDPCNPAHDVETLIIYDFSLIENELRFYVANIDIENPPVALQTIQNTCNLLEKIHNGHNKKSIKKTAKLRLAIGKQAKILMTAMRDYYKAFYNNDALAQQKAEKSIQKMVSRHSAYTMLMRSIAYDFEHLFD